MRRLFAILLSLAFVAAACGSDSDSDAATSSEQGSNSEGASAEGSEAAGPDSIVIGAIPDQEPEILARNYELVADYLSEEVGIEVTFQPVTEYDAAVTQFRVGDLDLVWFGGLTGVQARLQVEGAEAIVQRDIDAEFTSVFIANTKAEIEPFDSVDGLSAVAGKTFTFGSDSSTSGRLMPQSFMSEAGVSLDDLDGEPGFSGAHPKTIALVEAGTYQVGALNSQVWYSRVESGEVDASKVELIFETPPYFDYHWVAHPDLGTELTGKLTEALLGLDPSDPDEAIILEFFGAGSFIETTDANYAEIETIGRDAGKIVD